jgi:hypothetical protein
MALIARGADVNSKTKGWLDNLCTVHVFMVAPEVASGLHRHGGLDRGATDNAGFYSQ